MKSKDDQNSEILLSLTSEQTDYIHRYLSHPIIPTAKDLEVAYAIQDQLASAKQMALRKSLLKQKAQKTGETLAKFIIGVSKTGRDSFEYPDEVDNLMRRAIEFELIPRKFTYKYWHMIVKHPPLKEDRFLVYFDRLDMTFKIWKSVEGQLLPFLDSEYRRPFFTMCLEAVEDLMEKYKNV